MSKFRGAQPTKAGFSPGKVEKEPLKENDLKPLFSFEKMPERSGYSVDCCSSQEGAQVVGRMFKLGTMTWGQINQSGRHALGTEKIARSDIQVPIPPSVTKDATLLAFRYNGKKPMVGYREGRIFHVLWIDHNFTLYRH